MKQFFALSIVLSCLFIFGCADMDAPKAKDVIKDPLGPGVKIGMTKAEVISIYGEPDMKSIVRSDEWGGPREEWFYRARYSGLPVGAGYLSEDLYLYFDGDNLTNISKVSLGRSEGDSEADEIIK